MLKIGVDAMGGDFAPEAAVKGAVMALDAMEAESRIVLFGDRTQIEAVLAAEGCPSERFEIVHTTEVIEMGDHPAKAFQSKSDSSITVGFGYLARGAVQGFASAGSTGAMMVGSMYAVKPIEGVIRPFSLVMGRHVTHPDTSNLPFSYLIEEKNTTYLVPGVNLRSVGTIRDAQKWPKRDQRKDPNRLDQINYNLLSPYTIQKMMAGRQILKELARVSGETSEIYSYQSAKIKNSALNKGIKFYETAIHKFLGNSVIKRLEAIHFASDEEIRARLLPDTPIGTGEWVDISGLIAPKSEIERLMEDIECDRLNSVDEIHDRFAEMHANYYTYEWTWAYEKMLDFYGLQADTITAADIVAIVRQWQGAVVGLDKMVYEDAKKEFSLTSMTGFGADGSSEPQSLPLGVLLDVPKGLATHFLRPDFSLVSDDG